MIAMTTDHSGPDKVERLASAPVSRAHSGTGDHREYASLLRKIDLFAGLDRVVLAKLAAHLHPHPFSSSSTIFRQGEAGDAFYVVATGTVGVYVNDESNAGQARVRVLHAGEPFGEMALLTNTPRTATIRAETNCEVLRLERSSFLDLVREQPTVALAAAAAATRPRWRPGRAGIALAAAIGTLGAGWALHPPGLSPVAWHALVVLLAALPALLLDALL